MPELIYYLFFIFLGKTIKLAARQPHNLRRSVMAYQTFSDISLKTFPVVASCLF